MANKMADKKKTTSRSQMAEPRPRTTNEKAPTIKTAPRVERKEQPMPKQESRQARRDTKSSPGMIQRLRNGRVGRFITEAYYELRHKVTWPTFEEARNMTIVVIIISVVIGGILGLVDYGLYSLFLYISGR
ncbi:MAG: preprotein translocase subunit SecE [Ktedonobacteraceae bacterium]|nr:preprotein translocase subunit SecE [Ktedonobacteraceae bacterium]